jgi:hypothetical protein
VSQLLGAAIGSTVGAEVTSALAKITDDEQKVRDGEIDWKSKEGVVDRDLWGARPMMSEYCGLRETEDVYVICEIKNRGQQCGDFEPGTPERYACTTCGHRVHAPGAARDGATEQRFARMANAAVAVQASTQIAHGLLQSHRAGIAARKALEIGGAYAARGRVITAPEYLDHCSRLSQEGEFVICALQNPHHTCAFWTPAGSPAPARSTPQPAPSKGDLS